MNPSLTVNPTTETVDVPGSTLLKPYRLSHGGAPKEEVYQQQPPTPRLGLAGVTREAGPTVRVPPGIASGSASRAPGDCVGRGAIGGFARNGLSLSGQGGTSA